jgi:signal transduction histidine kinase
VLAHRGQVTCESQPGQGAVFHLTLPVWGTKTN